MAPEHTHLGVLNHGVTATILEGAFDGPVSATGGLNATG